MDSALACEKLCPANVHAASPEWARKTDRQKTFSRTLRAAAAGPPRAPQPIRLHSARPPAWPGPAPKLSIPIRCARCRPHGPAPSAWQLPHAIADSIARTARATRKVAPPDTATGCTRNAARRKTTSTPPSRLPLLHVARNPANAPEPSDAPAANCRSSSLCNIRSSAIVRRRALLVETSLRRRHPLDYAHLRAARPRITCDFRVAGLDHFFGEYAKSLVREPLEGVLHQTILDGVITEDDQPSSQIQSGRGTRKKLPEFLLFSIHRCPQRQKRFCRGMQSLPSPCFSSPCHNRCQVFGVAYGPRPYDRPGDSA